MLDERLKFQARLVAVKVPGETTRNAFSKILEGWKNLAAGKPTADAKGSGPCTRMLQSVVNGCVLCFYENHIDYAQKPGQRQTNNEDYTESLCVIASDNTN